ncbi:MAG: 5-formyltetrahydrofolate cyclo-ligase [bacterium]|nr:5-formyltetrahydrofolate cyclo-ligase [bacterium]
MKLPTMPDPSASKGTWRDWALERRTGVDWEAASAAIRDSLLAWGTLHSSASVLTYLPLAEEVNLQSLNDSSLECRWLTTRTPPLDELLTVHELDGPLEVHPYGFLQPHRSAPEVHPFDIDLLLIPGLTFDLWGNRLGRGAGYYDRLLSIVRPEVPLVGIVPVSLVVDRLPVEVHDVPMTHLATEEGVIETARG